MALQQLVSDPVIVNSDQKSKFENRLRLIAEKVEGIKKKDVLIKGYTRWRIYSDVIVIRCYKNGYTLHTNGDIDHYEVKEVKYKDVKYECNDLQFIANIIDNK